MKMPLKCTPCFEKQSTRYCITIRHVGEARTALPSIGDCENYVKARNIQEEESYYSRKNDNLSNIRNEKIKNYDRKVEFLQLSIVAKPFYEEVVAAKREEVSVCS